MKLKTQQEKTEQCTHVNTHTFIQLGSCKINVTQKVMKICVWLNISLI